MQSLPETGYLRLKQIIGDPKATPPIAPIIPVSKSTFWQGVRDNRYPQPTRALGRRITAWSVESIRAYLESAAANDADTVSHGRTNSEPWKDRLRARKGAQA